MIFKDGWTALIAACKEGHYEVVKELLECGAKIQLPDLVNIWIKILLEIKVRHVIISISMMLKVNNNTGIMNHLACVADRQHLQYSLGFCDTSGCNAG